MYITYNGTVLAVVYSRLPSALYYSLRRLLFIYRNFLPVEFCYIVQLKRLAPIARPRSNPLQPASVGVGVIHVRKNKFML